MVTPLIDPTKNVLDTLASAVKRIDDLYHVGFLRITDQVAAEQRRVNEQMVLRADYEEKLRVAESKRIDAIRAVDVNAVSIANDRATQQASVLAAQVSASADALRVLVASTAVATEQKQSQMTGQIMERIATLEKTSYKGEGSKAISAPMVGVVMAIIGGIVVFLIQQILSR